MNVESELIKVIKGTAEKTRKTSPYDTPAQVLRVEDGIAWVHIAGGVDETPVKLTMNAKEGDTVQVRVANGSAFLIGNATSPPTDDTTANVAVGVANKAEEKVTYLDGVVTEEIQANRAKFGELEADTAKIHNLTADQISSATAFVGDLTAENISAGDIAADHATVGDLDATYAEIDLANVNNAYINNGVFNTAAIVDGQVFTVEGNKATIKEINADEINVRNLNAKNLKIETANGYISLGDKKTPTKEFIDSLTDELNDRIDGAIETFTSTAVPTLTNYPANQWGTDEVRATHVGDVCYVVNSQIAQNGYCYRFTLNSGTFSWQLIKDSDVTAALQRLQTAEGKIGDIETFDEEIATFKTETEGDISTLQTKTTNLETSLGDKVDKTTFNQVSQKVDENSSSITTLETNVSKKADSSTVTTLSNTVNDVKQTATGNSSKISSLTQTLGTNADGTTKAGDIVHRTSAVEQDLSGFKSTVSSTYETKADANDVRSRLSTAETTISQTANNVLIKATKSDTTDVAAGKTLIQSFINVNPETVKISAKNVEIDGATTFNAIKTSADAAYDSKGAASAVQTNLDNLQIGGRNLVWDTEWKHISTRWSDWGSPTTREIVTINGKRWLHLVTTTTSFQGYSQAQDKRNGYGEIKAGDKVVISYSAYAKTAGQICTVGCHWRNSSGTIVAQNWFPSTLTTTEKRYISGVFTIPNNAVGFNVMVGDGTANAQELWISQVKIEFGTKATDWSPAPEDVQAEIDAKKSVHTLETSYSYNYSQLLTYANEYTTSWTVSSTTGVKTGDTVRLKMSVKDMSNTPVYIVGTVTSVASETRLTITSHGLDTTVIDGGNILTNSIGANQIQANAITADKIAANAITIGDMNQDAKDKVLNSNINVGGRNLLGGTANAVVPVLSTGDANNSFGSVARYNSPASEFSLEDYDETSKSMVITSSVTGNRGVGWYTHKGDVVAGEAYTFSCRVKSSVAATVHTHTAWRNGSATGGYTGWTAGGNVSLTANEWTDYSYTFTPDTAAKLSWEFMVSLCFTGQTTGVTCRIAHAKFEKGNKATDWEPAPAELAATATSYITDIDSQNGITIKAVNGNTDGSDDTKKNYIKLNTDGLDIYKGGASVAKYGDTARIGKDGQQRVEVTSSAVEIHDANGDLRLKTTGEGLELYGGTDTSHPVSTFKADGAYMGNGQEWGIYLTGTEYSSGLNLLQHDTGGGIHTGSVVLRREGKLGITSDGGDITLAVGGEHAVNISANNGLIINEHTTGIGSVLSATSSKTITTTGIDTYTQGASIKIPIGTWVITGSWPFNTGSSSGARNLGVALSTSSGNANTGILARQRVYAHNNAYAQLQVVYVGEFEEETTVYVKGASSMTYTSATTTEIRAVRIA